MANPFLLNLERRDSLTAEERDIVLELSSRKRLFKAKTDIVTEGDSPTQSCLMLSGFSARYNLIGEGKRQITAIHVSGEFVDLHSLLLARMDHSVRALTDCEIALVPHERLRELSTTHPHLTRMFWLLTIIDAAVYRRWLVASGCLSSAGQIAHFFCELFTRMEVVGETKGYTFRLPINQSELGDAMGLSLVHVNRTLQQLRKAGAIEWTGDQVRIIDWAQLTALAEFDPTYLNLETKKR
jgi:CRP-like cAMP-binding protein